MRIRKAIAGDLQALALLFDNYRQFYGKAADFTAGHNFLRHRLSNNDSEIFIAEDDHAQLVGFVQLYPIFSSTRMKRLWLLNDLFIQPEHRGKGISVALIDACKALCRNTDSCGMILETSKDNTIGNNLYRKTAFSLDGDHNYYEWSIEST
jgi:GNAT superfamily N-acetyltransferase